jgi:subtilase family serine protease
MPSTTRSTAAPRHPRPGPLNLGPLNLGPLNLGPLNLGPLNRRPRRGGTRAVLAPLAGVALAAGLALPAAAAAWPASSGLAAGRRVLPGYVPMWATPIADNGSATADLGPATDSAPVSARVYLAGQDPRGLAAYATAVSEPGGRLFHHYLTPAQVRRRFGPTAMQVAAVRSWLAGVGLRVTAVTSHYVAVTGTAAQARQAFGATWDSFQVSGRVQQSPPPSAQVTAPAGVASAVLTVVPEETGLPGSPGTAPVSAGAAAGHAGARSAPSATAPSATAPSAAAPSATAPSATAPSAAAPSAGAAPPCSRYFGQRVATSLPDAYGRPAPYGVCGYTPWQVRSAYGVPASLTGQHVTVAVVHAWAYPTAAQDLATYGARHGEPLRQGQFTQILPPGLDASCPNGIQAGHGRASNEETADIEAVHAMAPAADIVYLGARCDDDFGTQSELDALTRITDQHLASIVSNGSGVPVTSPGLIAAYEAVFEQGAAEGIGFYSPSGDYGDNSVHTPGHQPMPPGYPASDPWVTAVGGTSLAVGRHGRYEWETGWGDDAAGLTADGTGWADLPGTFAAGSGGGTSDLFAQPSYQRGVVPATLSRAGGSARPMRVVPDIAADADPATGVIAGETIAPGNGQPAQYEERAFGGTSAAAPLLAGLQADAEQAAGEPIGFANPAIYARYRRPARAAGTAAFRDVTDQPLGPGVMTDAVLPAGFGGRPGPLLETFGLDLGLTATPGYDNVTGVGTPAPGYFADSSRWGAPVRSGARWSGDRH